jgi:hypothetical protein
MNVNFCVKLLKLPSETSEMLKTVTVKHQAREATDVKVQDQNNTDLIFQHQGYNPS